jgi:hypothetical protein
MTLLACEDGGCTSSLEAYLLLEAKLTRKAVYLSGHGNIVLPGRVRGVRTLYMTGKQQDGKGRYALTRSRFPAFKWKIKVWEDSEEALVLDKCAKMQRGVSEARELP